MAIDDPLDAVEQQLAAEERARSPLFRFISDLTEVGSALAELIPDTDPFLRGFATAARFAGSWISRLETDRRSDLIKCLVEQVRLLRSVLENLDEAHERFIKTEFLPLVLDGLQKAEQTRSRERIERIAAILADSLEVGPSRAADVTEELMRIAANLGDQDVAVLRELVKAQRVFYNEKVGRPDFNEVNKYWAGVQHIHPDPARAPAFKLGISEGELQVACAKLQSFGLLVQTDSSAVYRQLGFPAFAILPRAIDFADSIQRLTSHAAKN